MKYWDSSAIVALLVEERATAGLREIHEQDPEQTVWCFSSVEIASAVARRVGEGLLPAERDSLAAALRLLSERWREIVSLEPVRSRALRLVHTHPLRAGDALQLAAALVATDERPEVLPFVCVDERLRDCARSEGFPVLPA